MGEKIVGEDGVEGEISGEIRGDEISGDGTEERDAGGRHEALPC